MATPGILFGHFTDIGTFHNVTIEVVLKLDKAGLAHRDLQRESAVLSELQTNQVPGVVHLYDYHTASSPRYLVLQTHGESLEAFLLPDNLATLKIVAGRLVRAVRGIHAAGLMHGDLKPANVLVKVLPGGRFELKLADFDSARFVGRGGESLFPHTGGRLKYTAGERASSCLPVCD